MTGKPNWSFLAETNATVIKEARMKIPLYRFSLESYSEVLKIG